MVVSCPTCHYSKIITEYESQALCCTECGLIFESSNTQVTPTIEPTECARIDEPSTTATTTTTATEIGPTSQSSKQYNNQSSTGETSTCGSVNQSRCRSVPHLYQSRYKDAIYRLQSLFNTTDEETMYVIKLCRLYLYHPLHIYCRQPTEVILCLYYLVVLQHRQSERSTSLSEWCHRFDGNLSFCLRIYTVMRFILAAQLASAPRWHDPLYQLDNIMTNVFPLLISTHSPLTTDTSLPSPSQSQQTPFFYLIRYNQDSTGCTKKRKQSYKRSITHPVKRQRKSNQGIVVPTTDSATKVPLIWPTNMDHQTIRHQTMQLYTIATYYGYGDGRHTYPLVLVCLVITMLSYYHRHSDSSSPKIIVHWQGLTSLVTMDTRSRTLQNRYSELLTLLYTFAKSLPWLQNGVLHKERDTLSHLEDILPLMMEQTNDNTFDPPPPPAFQQSFQRYEKRKTQLASIEANMIVGKEDEDLITQYITQLVASGKWDPDTIATMNDPELANHAHRLARPVDDSHDLDRQDLDDFDLSPEEQTIYLL
ncbi:hypothetical protein BC941DRAFT_442041 [Chlamydoabsidia padenii]|nr:hypothetical protein BC941DRAFT_442041 [Chlamydoabsidia padenii]